METTKTVVDESTKDGQDKVADDVQKQAHHKLSELQAQVEQNLEESTSKILPVEITSDNPNLQADLLSIKEQFSNFIQVAESTTEQIKVLGLQTFELDQIKAKIIEHKLELVKATEHLTEVAVLKEELERVRLEAQVSANQNQDLAKQISELRAQVTESKSVITIDSQKSVELQRELDE
jgi:hypothetical protein